MKSSDTSDLIRYRPAGTALLATHRVEVFWPGDYPSDDRWDRFEAECKARGVPFVGVSENDWPTRPVILVDGHIHGDGPKLKNS